jgi:hypothetical protein
MSARIESIDSTMTFASFGGPVEVGVAVAVAVEVEVEVEVGVGVAVAVAVRVAAEVAAMTAGCA